jgi:hypothetical protein
MPQLGHGTGAGGGNQVPDHIGGYARVSWNFSITQCDAVGKLAGIRPVAAGPGQP